MENIILFMALFSATATAAQVSLFRHFWQQLGFGVVLAGFVYLFYPYAIEFSNKDVEQVLANAAAMTDLALVLVLEAVLMVILALVMLREIYTQLSLTWRWALLLQIMPLASAIGALCFYEVALYQQGWQQSFETIAYAYGALTGLAVLLLAYLIKWLIPSRVLRLELKLAMHAALFVLGVATAVLTASIPYRQSAISANGMEFVAVVVLVASGFGLGLLHFRRQLRKQLLNNPTH